MLQARFNHTASVLLTCIAMLAGCGGGGGGDATPTDIGGNGGGGAGGGGGGGTATTFRVWRGASLPGRLLVNSPSRPAVVYDLADGKGQQLPMTDAAEQLNLADADTWTWAASGRLIRYGLYPQRSGGVPITLFSGSTLQPELRLSLGRSFRGMRMSRDGRHLLTMYTNEADGETSPRLTVLDAASGQIVKRGSRLDALTSAGTQFDWLPDGRYVYRLGANLYVSSPTASASQKLAYLPLPGTTASDPEPDFQDWGDLAVSPDGTRIAFTYQVERQGQSLRDAHFFVARLDGSELRQLTGVFDASLPMSLAHTHPTWSPDGQWIAGVLYMQNTNVQPVYPSDDTTNPAFQIVASSGCGFSPVFVLPATADQVALPWPKYDSRFNLQTQSSASQGMWLSSCASEIEWLS